MSPSISCRLGLGLCLVIATFNRGFSQVAPTAADKQSKSAIDGGVSWIEGKVNGLLQEKGVQEKAGDPRTLLDQYKIHFLLLFDTSQSANSEYRDRCSSIAKAFLQNRKSKQGGSVNQGAFSSFAYQLDLYGSSDGPAAGRAHAVLNQPLSDVETAFDSPTDMIPSNPDNSEYKGGKNHQKSREKAMDLALKASDLPLFVIQFASTAANETGKSNVVVPKESGAIGGLPIGYHRLGEDLIQPLHGDSKVIVWVFGPDSLSSIQRTDIKPPDTVAVPPPSGNTAGPDPGPTKPVLPDHSSVSSEDLTPLIVGGVIGVVIVALVIWAMKQHGTVSFDKMPVGQIFAMRPQNLFAASDSNEKDSDVISLSKRASGNLPEGGIIAKLKYDAFAKSLRVVCSGGFTIITSEYISGVTSISIRSGEFATLTFKNEVNEVESLETEIGVE